MPDVQEAAEQATFWVSFGQAAGLVGVTAAATAVGALIASRAIDNIDPAALEEMENPTDGRRRRLTLEEVEQLQQQQQQQQQQGQQQQTEKK